MKTTYYDTMRDGLVPVKVIATMTAYNNGKVEPTGLYACRVQRTRGLSYKAGEMLYLPACKIVVKAGRKNGFTQIRSADLSGVE